MKENRAKNGGEDKYYTRPFIADYVTQLVIDKFNSNIDYIEPSAGSGVFIDSYKKITNQTNIQGYDINPHSDNIIKQDWFTISKDKVEGKAVIGNPPFGFASSLAIKFFNKAAEQEAHSISFIVPKTFRKESTHNKLDLNYKLVLDIDLPKNAFFFYEKDNVFYDVPTVFQIWQRVKKPRELVQMLTTSQYFDFVDNSSKYDVCVRRAGGKAGQIVEGDLTPSSTYFLKLRDNRVIHALKIYDYSKYVDNTAGVKSISKHELVTEVDLIMCVLNSSLPQIIPDKADLLF
jgi:hypothetical protein